MVYTEAQWERDEARYDAEAHRVRMAGKVDKGAKDEGDSGTTDDGLRGVRHTDSYFFPRVDTNQGNRDGILPR